mmetsp:Transcript_12624/g.23293  ORF Transcript_12624/g.23293 Transcript_12624/m.23293 type:complete len:217 (-) Transcript_12624:168-818(-)
MSKLRISKFMNGPRGIHAKVSPNIGRRTKVDLLDAAGGGFKSRLGVLGSDTHGDTVPIRGDTLRNSKVNHRLAIRHVLLVREAVLPVQFSDFGNVIEGNSHGHLKLCRGEVHPGDHLGDGMFHLETGVQFQKVVFFVGFGVEVFDRAGVGVPHCFGEGDGRVFHLFPHLGRGSNRGTFLDDLLMTSLDGAVTSIERNGIAILIRQKLHLQMPRIGR